MHLELQPLIEAFILYAPLQVIKYYYSWVFGGQFVWDRKSDDRKHKKTGKKDRMVSITGNFRWLTSNSSLQ